VPTAFTMTSPTSMGPLPEGVTEVGGVVIDLVGANGARVVSQIPASSLFRGVFNSGTPASSRGNPGTIGVQQGFSAELLNALGGGIAEMAVRITLNDGDTGPGDFDDGENRLLINGDVFGNFSNVATQQTSNDGMVVHSNNPAGGFRNNLLDTGFFYSDDPLLLARIFQTLTQTNEALVQLADDDPFDNQFDFTQGLDGGLSGIGIPPTISNKPPVIASITNNGPISEGGTARIIVTASDPDAKPGESLEYFFDLDNNGTYEVSNRTGTIEQVFGAPGAYTVPVKVRDPKGGEATGSTVIRVDAIPSALVPPLPQQSLEGHGLSWDLGALTGSASATDWTVTVDWGDGSPAASFPLAGPGDLGSLPHVYGQDGSYSVTVTARRGPEAIQSQFAASVINVAPQLTLPAAQTAAEGTAKAFSLGSFLDPGAEGGWKVFVDWGDGSAVSQFVVTAPGDLGSLAHAFPQDGVYQVKVRVADDDDAAEGTFSVVVENVAPLLSGLSFADSAEGSEGTLALGSLIDPGLEPEWWLSVDWGDGSPVVPVRATAAGDLGTLRHAYAQDGEYRVTVSVSDGAATTVATTAAKVTNVAPLITPGSAQPAGEGGSVPIDLGSFADPGADAKWLVTVDWGDGSAFEVFEALETGALGSRVHAYAQDGRYQVVVTVRDDHSTSQGTFAVDVRNEVPFLIAPADQSAVEGQAGSFDLGSAIDPGAEPGWLVTVDWGDGSGVETFGWYLGTGSLGLRDHAYAQPGSYTVAVTIQDDHDLASMEFRVDVAAAPVIPPVEPEEPEPPVTPPTDPEPPVIEPPTTPEPPIVEPPTPGEEPPVEPPAVADLPTSPLLVTAVAPGPPIVSEAGPPAVEARSPGSNPPPEGPTVRQAQGSLVPSTQGLASGSPPVSESEEGEAAPEESEATAEAAASDPGAAVPGATMTMAATPAPAPTVEAAVAPPATQAATAATASASVANVSTGASSTSAGARREGKPSGSTRATPVGATVLVLAAVQQRGRTSIGRKMFGRSSARRT
jgi:PKD repeat protein